MLDIKLRFSYIQLTPKQVLSLFVGPLLLPYELAP